MRQSQGYNARRVRAWRVLTRVAVGACLVTPCWVHSGAGTNTLAPSAVLALRAVNADTRGGEDQYRATVDTQGSVSSRRLLARAEQEDNQKLVEILEKSGTDPLGNDQLMKDAIQASDLSLTANGAQGGQEFARQLEKIRANNMAVTMALGSKDAQRRIKGATAALQLKGRQLDVIAQAVASLRAKNDGDSKTLLDTLYNIAAARSKLIFEEADGKELEAQAKRLKELERSRDRQQMKLIQIGQTLQGDNVTALTLAQVQERLGERDVLVEWTRVNPFDFNYVINRGKGRMWGDPRYVVFVIVRDKAPEVVDLGPASVIEPLVMKLLAQLRKPTDVFDPADSKLLFNLVVKPWLAPMAGLTKQVDQLLLAPDGALNSIPFAVLMDDEGKYFGERHTLNYLTSGRELLRLQGTTAVETKWREQLLPAI